MRERRPRAGVDLTERAVSIVQERLLLREVPGDRYELRQADAENLPFADERFDLVYSWGVLHHTPDTARAFREARRVLKPGGTLKAMIYHVPSWAGLLLSVRRGLLRGKPFLSQRKAIYSIPGKSGH